MRIVVAAAALLGAGACDVPRFSFPRPRSEQAKAILALWQGAFIAAAVIGVLVIGLILWCVLRYRATGDDGPLPTQTEYIIPPEDRLLRGHRKDVRHHAEERQGHSTKSARCGALP